MRKMRYSVQCAIQTEGQGVGQSGREGDLEGLHAFGGGDELDSGVGGWTEARLREQLGRTSEATMTEDSVRLGALD